MLLKSDTGNILNDRHILIKNGVVYNNPTTITCNENLYLSSDHTYKMKFNYKYTLFSDNHFIY